MPPERTEGAPDATPSREEQERIWAQMPDSHLYDDDRQPWPDDMTWDVDGQQVTEAEFQDALAEYRLTGVRPDWATAPEPPPWPSRAESARILRRFYSWRGRVGRVVWRLRWRLRDRRGEMRFGPLVSLVGLVGWIALAVRWVGGHLLIVVPVVVVLLAGIGLLIADGAGAFDRTEDDR